MSVRVPALQLLLGGQPEEKPDLAKLASPVAHVDPTDPPLWLIHGNADPQMPIEQSRELASVYRSHGLPVELSTVEGGKHGGSEFFTSERLDVLRQGFEQSFVSRSIGDSTNVSSTTQPRPQRNHGDQPEASNSVPVRMLFAGSSSTYWNDLPDGIARVVSGQSGEIRGRPVSAEIVGRSGSDIRVYLDPQCNYQYGVKQGQSFLEKVRDEPFDYVVLMVVGRFITGDGENNPDGKAHADAVTTYCHAIRQSGAEPVFYEMGWGTTERDEEGRRRIFELAKKNKIRIYALVRPSGPEFVRIALI